MYSFSGFEMAKKTGAARLTEAKADGTYFKQLESFADTLEAELKKIAPAVEKVVKDESLSAAGKAFTIAKYLVQCWNAIEKKADGVIVELEQVQAQIGKKINAAPYGYALDPVERLLLAQEVRQQIYKEMATEEGPYRLRALYMKACEDGSDPLFCYSVETAPRYHQVFDDKVLLQGKGIRAKREHPEEVRQLELLDVLRGAYDYVLYHAKTMLKDAGLPATNYDWGQVEFVPKDGANYEIKLLSLRHMKSAQLSENHRTTARQAELAGLKVSAQNSMAA